MESWWNVGGTKVGEIDTAWHDLKIILILLKPTPTLRYAYNC
jgi:hypothetical protein